MLTNRNILSAITMAAILGSFALGGASCRRSGAPAGAMKKKAGEKVGRIVFVGKKQACDCTKRRVKESWEALRFALEKHASVKVERIAMDVDKGKVKQLRGQRRFMTLPALYFFNPQGELVAMLEGELQPDQIAKALE
jgi:hypothetical protein